MKRNRINRRILKAKSKKFQRNLFFWKTGNFIIYYSN